MFSKIAAGAAFIWIVAAFSWAAGKLTERWLNLPLIADNLVVMALGFAALSAVFMLFTVFLALGSTLLGQEQTNG